jgi:hypothetical protein
MSYYDVCGIWGQVITFPVPEAERPLLAAKQRPFIIYAKLLLSETPCQNPN